MPHRDGGDKTARRAIHEVRVARPWRSGSLRRLRFGWLKPPSRLKYKMSSAPAAEMTKATEAGRRTPAPPFYISPSASKLSTLKPPERKDLTTCAIANTIPSPMTLLMAQFAEDLEIFWPTIRNIVVDVVRISEARLRRAIHLAILLFTAVSA